VNFWTVVRDQALAARTPYLLLAFAVALLLMRNLATDGARPALRGARAMLALHLLSQLIAAGQIASGYDAHHATIAALGFELLCVVAMATTVSFRVVLPRLGIVFPRILMDLLTGIAVIVALIYVGKRAGFSVAGLITTSAVLTAVIGFSLQDTLGNVMGGLALQMDNSVRVGDWISLGPGQVGGRVTEIRWRYTAIETRAWETVIIPNGVLMKSQVIIAGRRTDGPQQWRRHIDFFVDFRTSPSKVIETALGALRRDPLPNMATSPEPQLLFTGVRDSYAQYQFRYWLCDLNHDEPTDSDVRVRIYFALRRAGISLSIPAQALFVTAETPEREQRKQDEDLAQRMTAISHVDLFAALPMAMKKKLASHLLPAPFAHGESVTREGDRDDGLFVIVSGDASVRIGEPPGKQIAVLGPGEFFGEMSLMTGEARAATVIATTDLECFRVDKSAFYELLREEPDIAEEIAEILAQRRVALEAARDGALESKPHRLATEKQDLLGRIRGFFGLFE
jgi:small-conductance mechanosensitive channel